MNVTIIGTGYVGLVTAACLAEVGNTVICVDKDAKKIAQLTAGELPFYEPELSELVRRGVHDGRISFTCDLADSVSNAHVVFIAIGTPATQDGHANVDDIFDCAARLQKILVTDVVLAIKSTVPVGTCEQIQTVFDRSHATIAVVSNPEFLAEGRAIQDFRMPERIVIGGKSRTAHDLLKRLYGPFDPDGTRLLWMDIRSAEFSKYACNAMLAARISMINELACIAGQVDADILSVCKVLSTDSRIGPHYMRPGAGYGGSCLPKDLRALIGLAQEHNEPAQLLRSVESVNARQGQLILQSLTDHFAGLLEDKCIAVWGLSFKPGTDDLRAAPSLTLIDALLAAGATVQAYDPVAMNAAKKLIKDSRLTLMPSAESACVGADALVVMTEWEQFKNPDLAFLARSLSTGAVFDGRHLYRSEVLATHQLLHYRLGSKAAVTATPSKGSNKDAKYFRKEGDKRPATLSAAPW
ncbi:UDP-glucose/GDP-mannose dehydrogenase family protein [Candidimonas sp. SYP-B2681]|uniref:UDP-glucose dehydrogenase family protein n=1 Tax=Candidimonas sp. SYP-B2681 TaxID=2497686 RepID=UPI0013152D3F|nr:UDP-glucose/GDP-mannose dehydrogenase family protein [Candidimonas sp. SYP-B2681]